MAHFRETLRARLVTQLSGLATTGTRVFNSPVYPAGESSLPGLSIKTLEEKLLSAGDPARKIERREIIFQVEARSKPGEGTDPHEQIDDIISEVLVSLSGNLSLGGGLQSMKLRELSITFDGDMERPVGVAKMVWRGVYLISQGSPNLQVYSS